MLTYVKIQAWKTVSEATLQMGCIINNGFHKVKIFVW